MSNSWVDGPFKPSDFITEAKVFPPVKDKTSRYGAYPDAERAAAFANAETKRTGRQHMVSSEMGMLCPNCAPNWNESEPMPLTVEPGYLDQCYNCNDR